MSDRESRWRLFEDRPEYVDRFGLLLIVTALAVVTLSLIDLGFVDSNLRSEIGQVLVTLFVGGTLLLALRASGVGRRMRILADVLVGLGILATVVAVAFVELSDTGTELGRARYVWTGLALIAPVLVIRRLVHHDRASGATLLGSVSAYLLIALAFNFAFLTLDDVQTEHFFGRAEPTTSFMYYSLVTITTLGYGDLAAVTPAGRLLSTIEAVIGQVYLVTFVAMIVGLIVEQRQRQRNADRSG
ncbi:MAG TPA: ion channel [Acidimicrobiia bacterium]|nr:ion channel [Acidimicrobiia bacterium]